MLMERNQLASFYRRYDSREAFRIGRVLAFDNSYYMIKCYDEYGIYNGIYIGLIKDLCRIETASIYLDKIEKLIKASKQTNTSIIFAGDTKHLLDRIITQLINYKKVILAVLDHGNTQIYGIVLEKKDSYLKMEQFDIDGFPNGYSFGHFYEISSIEVDTKECNKYEMLKVANHKDERYGKRNYDKCPRSDYNNLKKYGDRGEKR